MVAEQRPCAVGPSKWMKAAEKSRFSVRPLSFQNRQTTFSILGSLNQKGAGPLMEDLGHHPHTAGRTVMYHSGRALVTEVTVVGRNTLVCGPAWESESITLPSEYVFRTPAPSLALQMYSQPQANLGLVSRARHPCHCHLGYLCRGIRLLRTDDQPHLRPRLHCEAHGLILASVTRFPFQ